jgi:diguanylate cyclase (GGDEF)-like protein
MYIGLSGLEFVAVAAGTIRYRPPSPRSWRLFGLAAGIYAAANTIWYGMPILLDRRLPFPSVADALYILAYLCFIAGFLLLIRSRTERGRGAGVLIDAAIITVSAMVILWKTVLSPIAAEQSETPAAHWVAVGYPLIDLVLVALLVATLLTPAARPPAFWLLTGFVLAQLAADISFAVTQLRATFYYGHPLMLGWFLSFGCLGAAALHPSMRSVVDPSYEPRRTHMSKLRLLLLAAAALTAPAVGLVRGDSSDTTDIMAWSGVLFLLCIARMAVLVRETDRNARALASRDGELHVTLQMLHESEEHFSHQARHDALTGLPNRLLFRERLDQALARPDQPLAVMLLDIDGFKTVNDSLGHAAGDELLVVLAGRLTSALRPTDIVARLGGDEFTILAENQDGTAAVRLATRVLRTLEDPIQVEGHQVFVRASVGIAVSPSAGGGELLRDADAAMYEAKRKGGQRYELFTADMHARVLDRLAMEHDLRKAELGAAMTVHYQPIVDLGSGRVTGFEALLRWRHPDRGMVPPDEFIPVAEEMGIIVLIGRWVLREACSHARSWGQLHPRAAPIGMSVNISAGQLTDPAFADDVGEILQETEFDPANLTLEITETMLLADEDEAVRCLKRLKELGVRISVDDFGTGYSSLSHLERFPVDELKIDKSFVAGMVSDQDGGIARGSIRLARGLHIDVVAEGIETEQQLAELRRASCARGQGYYFWKPMDAHAVGALLVEEDQVHTQAPLPETAARVLVVDDDEALRRSLVRILAAQGFEMLQAANGRQALDLAHQTRLDAVILDVDLPFVDGFVVCQELRRHSPDIAVVHLSGTAVDVSERVRGLDLGADAYLIKPVPLAELVATLRAALRRAS